MPSKNMVRLGGAYVEITADNGKLVNALKDSESRIQTFVNEFAKTGAAFSALGLGVAAPIKKTVDTFAEFEKQMLITQAVTKATDAQLARLTKQAKDLGATTSWTASQVAEGMVALGRMGFSNREIQGTISSVMDLGRALDTDVNQAAKELGAVMRQFQADSSEAGHYADALATATNGAAIEMDELLESMKYVGTAGNALGADVETVLALTMALRNAGVSASQAGTQLRSMFVSLQAPKNLQLFADKFGVEIYDANGRLKSFIDILVEAQKRAGALGDQLLLVARQMFGKLQAPGFLALLQSPDLERFRDMLYQCDGAAESFRKGMESGMFGSLKRSLSYVEATSIALGGSLKPTITEVEDVVKDLTDVARGFIEENKPLINLIAKTALEFGSLGATMLVGSGIMKGLAGTSRMATSGFVALAAAWRKAGAQANGLDKEIASVEVAAESLAKAAPGETLAASLNTAATAAKEATFAVEGLVNAEAKLGQTFTVAGSRTPERRIDASQFSPAGGALVAPASVSAAIDARAQTAQANAEARNATNEAIKQARRDATITATAAYNAETAAIHESRMSSMTSGASFTYSTQSFLDAEQRAAEHAYRADLNKPLSSNYGYSPHGNVVAKAKGATFGGTTMTLGAAAAGGRFGKTDASFFIPQTSIPNSYGFSVAGKQSQSFGTVSSGVSKIASSLNIFQKAAKQSAASYDDLLEKFAESDAAFMKAHKQWVEYNPSRWNLAGRAKSSSYYKEMENELNRVISEFERIYGTKAQYNARGNTFSSRSGAGSSFDFTGSTENINATARATENAANVTYTLNDAASKTAESEKKMGEAGQVAGKKVAAGSKAGAFGMQALQFATNAAVGALKFLGGMAVTMLAWQAVAAIFEKIAASAHKAAEDMKAAREANVNSVEQAAERNDDLSEGIREADATIDKFISGAGSDKKLNNVEAKRLERLYDKLKEAGYITDAEVVKDEESGSGFRVVSAGAAATMKARARERALDQYEKAMNSARIDLSSIDPALVKNNPLMKEATFGVAVEVAKKYQPLADALNSLTAGQRRDILGGAGVESLDKELKRIDETARRNATVIDQNGMIESFDEKFYNTSRTQERLMLFIDRIANAERAGSISEESKEQLKRLFFSPTDGITSAVSQFAGADWLEQMAKLKGMILPEKVINEIREDIDALEKDAEENRDKPYSSPSDASKAEADAASVVADVKSKYAELDAMMVKAEDRNKTPSQRALDALDAKWKEIQEGIGLDKEGKVDLSNLGEEDLKEYYKKEKGYLEAREELQKQINEELEKEKKQREREAEERARENSEKVNEGLNADMKDFIGAIFSGNGKKADELGAGIDAQLRNFEGTDVDLSKFYEESVATIKDALEKTKTTLASVGTFNALEFADFGRDVELDIQKEQLNMLRSANAGLQNIYAWMQTDDKYKEYM